MRTGALTVVYVSLSLSLSCLFLSFTYCLFFSLFAMLSLSLWHTHASAQNQSQSLYPPLSYVFSLSLSLFLSLSISLSSLFQSFSLCLWASKYVFFSFPVIIVSISEHFFSKRNCCCSAKGKWKLTKKNCDFFCFCWFNLFFSSAHSRFSHRCPIFEEFYFGLKNKINL